MELEGAGMEVAWIMDYLNELEITEIVFHDAKFAAVGPPALL